MRQLTFVEAGRVEWEEAADPQLRDSQAALVRPLAVARCDLDQPMAAFGIFPGPFAFGEAGGGHGGAVADLLAVPAADHMLLPAPRGSAAALCALPDNACDAYR